MRRVSNPQRLAAALGFKQAPARIMNERIRRCRNAWRHGIAFRALPLCFLLWVSLAPAAPAQPELALARQIAVGRWFPEPLRFGRDPSEAENTALFAALQKFSGREIRDDFSALTAFLEDFADGAWSESLLASLGSEYFRQGYYSRSLAAWETVWNQRATAPPGAMPAVANAVGRSDGVTSPHSTIDSIV